MGDLVFLEAQGHAGLRVNTANASGRHFVQLVVSEFPQAACEYPILFTKHPETGAFYPGAVMGLEAGRNLYAHEGALPGYRPADLVRQGFYVVDDRIAIDPEDPVFSGGDQPLFDDRGEPTHTLRLIQQAMQQLAQGLQETSAVLDRFVEHRLLEPIDIALDFDDGSHLRLDGLYSVSLDALHALDDDAALALFRHGDLQLAYLQSASVRHIRNLARRRNEQLFAAA
ncbi:SapC family protein [Aurantiacibacter xanthus]|uniref:SapC family protein n=1 Tax=Aurantiacibacter xanthus TaxID=1784712 RepID=UPI001FE2B0A6|nr:SapC family protein [Aurantiacibacter xanthus]